MEIHKAAFVPLELPRVQKSPCEPRPEGDVHAAAAPLPAGRRRVPLLRAGGASAGGDVAPRARRRHRVRHPGARNCVRERCLS